LTDEASLGYLTKSCVKKIKQTKEQKTKPQNLFLVTQQTLMGPLL
jgi:hypothetical protein